MASNHLFVAVRTVRRPPLTLVAALVAWIVAFWPVWRQWSASWLANPQYEHGPLLALASAVLILRDLRGPADSARKGREVGWIAALAAASLGWAVAWLAGIAVASQVLVLVCGWLLIRVLLGASAARSAAFPVFWLLFASEIWEYAAPPLQSLAAGAAKRLLVVASFPVHVEGARISVPAGDFLIEEGCSGVKYLITFLALACLIIRLGRFRPAHRVAVLVTAALLAVLANWIRVMTLIWIGQATHLQHPLIHDHYLFGWLLFVAALVPFVLLVRRLQRLPEEAGVSGFQQGAGGWQRPDPVADDLPQPPHRTPLASAAPPLKVLAGLGAALCGPAITLLVSLSGGSPVQALPAPPTVPAESDASSARAHFVPLGTSDGALARYGSPGGDVEFGAVALRPPIGSGVFQELLNRARGGGKPVAVAGRTAVLTGAAGNVIRFSEMESATLTGGRKIVRFWFENGGVTFARSSTAKLATALRALVDARQMKIFVAESDCSSDCRASRQRLDDFMRGLPQ